MPTLDWIGKKAVEAHHKKVPFHLLRQNDALSAGEAESGNLLVQGDNLLALKALLPYYAGQVKCIYIDPPYNTGNENWVYNDNVNSAEIREWLGKVVGKDAEDLSRHDKWLCMMYPRLILAKDFLSEHGVIFVSIDDTELPRLRVLMDELFLPKNLIACFVWQTEGNFDNQAKVKIAHEYVLAYAKNYHLFPPPPVIDPNTPERSKLFRDHIQNTIVKNGPKNPKSNLTLPSGFPANFQEGVIPKRDKAWPHYSEDVVVKDYALVKEAVAWSGWSSKSICQSFIDSGFQPVPDSKGQQTTFFITETGAIESKKARTDSNSHVISVVKEVGTTQQMSAFLKGIGINFDYPKPVGLIKYLLSMIRGENFTVMDFFAGSGTTGHAVLALNKEDGGNRRFVLVEMDENICRNITAQRLSRVVNGYTAEKQGGKQEEIPALGGGFRFCELGETLFNVDGTIRDAVTFDDLARHVFFVTTGEPLPENAKARTPLIGTSKGVGVYLLYNGILRDKSPQGGNALTNAVLSALPPHDGAKIMYGTSCRVSAERLRREGVTFRQIPYELRVG